MHDNIQSSDLKAQTRRLRSFGLPLVLVILVNIVLIMRVPMPDTQQAKAGGPHPDGMPNAGERPADSRFVPPVLPNGVLVLGTDQATLERAHTAPSMVERSDDAVESTTNGEAKFAAAHPTEPQDHQQPAVDAAVAQAGATAADLATRAWARLPEMSWPVDQWRHDAQLAAQRWVHTAQDAIAQMENRSADPYPESHAQLNPLAMSSGSAANDETANGSYAPATDDAAAIDLHITLTVRNPVENGETVRFLINERLCELLPGEAHRFAPAESWLIRFHRGGEFGDVERSISNGAYRFTISSQGWDLIPVQASVIPKK